MGDDEVTNDERIEHEDDEERYERVEYSVNPRPDIGYQRLVTFHSSAVSHVGTGYLTAPTAAAYEHVYYSSFTTLFIIRE